ncbi:MAG: hypothetical protein ABSG88_17610 [Bradyrhizobium sp.]
MLIPLASRRERPGVSQHIAPHLDEVGHLAAGFRLCLSVGGRHDALFGSGESFALLTVAAECAAVTVNYRSLPF